MNTILQRTFSGAWKLMEEQTIIKEAYKEVKLPDMIPTTKTLKDKKAKIVIQHKGKNKKYGA